MIKTIRRMVSILTVAVLLFPGVRVPAVFGSKLVYGDAVRTENSVFVPIMNCSAQQTSIVFVVAVYQGKCLYSVKAENILLNAYEQRKAEANVVFPETQSEVRTFVWNSLEEMKPIPNEAEYFAPTELEADFTGGTRAAAYHAVPLRWNQKESLRENTAYYKIERDGVHIADTANLFYTDTGLEAGEEHTYRVRAVSTLGISSTAVEQTVNTQQEALLDYRTENASGMNLYQLASMPVTSGATNVNTPAVKEGVSCVLVEPILSKIKYVSYDIDDEYLRGDGVNGLSASIFVTFFDNGTVPIELAYDSTNDNEGEAPGFTRVTIPRYDTNTWRTAEVTIANGDFRNSQSTAVGGVSIGADFRFTGRNSQLYISCVKVVKHPSTIHTEDNALWRDTLLRARILNQKQADSPGALLTRRDAQTLIRLATGQYGAADGQRPIKPDEVIYPIEFLQTYLTALGYPAEHDQAIALAAKLKIWHGETVSPLCVGDAALMLANGLQVPPRGENEPSFSLVMASGLITKEEIRASAHAKLIYLMNGGRNMQLDMKMKTDLVSGRKYAVIGKEKSDTSTFYFTGGSSFTADSGKLIVNMDYHLGSVNCMFGLFDMETKTTETVAEGVHFYEGITSPVNKFFYTKGSEAFLYDINTKETRKIGDNPEGRAFYGPPSMTNDGKTASVYWRDSEGKTRNAGLFDLETGNFTQILFRDQIMDIFEAPQNMFDHPILNPEDKHTVFFNRGNDTYIPDRMYLLDVTTGNIKNMYHQQTMPDGTLGEAIGHESWSFDGEWMYFVKYPDPFSKIKPTGIMRVSKDCSRYEYVNTNHPFWHASPSPDGKWVVGDYFLIDNGDGRYKSKIAICNIETKESYVLAEFYISTQHPSHPHPAFSYDGKKICFTILDEYDEFNSKVAVMDVSDIVSK